MICDDLGASDDCSVGVCNTPVRNDSWMAVDFGVGICDTPGRDDAHEHYWHMRSARALRSCCLPIRCDCLVREVAIGLVCIDHQCANSHISCVQSRWIDVRDGAPYNAV